MLASAIGKASRATEKKETWLELILTKEALSRYDPVVAGGALPSVRRALGGSGPPRRILLLRNSRKQKRKIESKLRKWKKTPKQPRPPDIKRSDVRTERVPTKTRKQKKLRKKQREERKKN